LCTLRLLTISSPLTIWQSNPCSTTVTTTSGTITLSTLRGFNISRIYPPVGPLKVLRISILILLLPSSRQNVVPPIVQALLQNDCYKHSVKGKAVLLQASSDPEGSRKLRFLDFMTTTQDGVKAVSLTHLPPLTPGNTPGTHFC